MLSDAKHLPVEISFPAAPFVTARPERRVTFLGRTTLASALLDNFDRSFANAPVTNRKRANRLSSLLSRRNDEINSVGIIRALDIPRRRVIVTRRMRMIDAHHFKLRSADFTHQLKKIAWSKLISTRAREHVRRREHPLDGPITTGEKAAAFKRRLTMRFVQQSVQDLPSHPDYIAHATKSISSVRSVSPAACVLMFQRLAAESGRLRTREAVHRCETSKKAGARKRSVVAELNQI
jgi:hypothetical protein